MVKNILKYAKQLFIQKGVNKETEFLFFKKGY